VIAGGVSSPKAIAFGLLGLVSLVVLVRVDWISVIDRVREWGARRRGRPAPPSIREQIQARSCPTAPPVATAAVGPAAALAHRPVVR
jgi:hypothetical protein